MADGIANTLTGFDGGNALRQTHLIAQAGRLRTLTLTEMVTSAQLSRRRGQGSRTKILIDRSPWVRCRYFA